MSWKSWFGRIKNLKRDPLFRARPLYLVKLVDMLSASLCSRRLITIRRGDLSCVRCTTLQVSIHEMAWQTVHGCKESTNLKDGQQQNLKAPFFTTTKVKYSASGLMLGTITTICSVVFFFYSFNPWSQRKPPSHQHGGIGPIQEQGWLEMTHLWI